MNNRNLEIEKKYLVKYMPDLSKISNLKEYVIKQAYISTTPLLRIRQRNNQYFFTYKSSGSIERTEVEELITQEQFLNLWEKIEGTPIIKKRYTFPIAISPKTANILFAELDVYEGELEGFKNVEVEFSSVKEANNFIPPDWFGEDVTDNFEYTNANLSKNPEIVNKK
ncbi:MAG: adenylate cyclase [bacterium]